MSTSKRSPVLVILLLILGGLIVYIASHFEPYEQTINTGWSREALYNPYLAAQKFLNNKGLESTSSYRLASTNSLQGNDSLIIDRSLALQSQKRIEEVLKWVEQGGQLFVGADPVSLDEQNDPLLTRLNIEFYSIDYECEDCEEMEDESNEEPELIKKIKEKQKSKKEEEANQENKEEFSDEDVEELAEELVKLYKNVIHQKTPQELREEAESSVEENELTLVSFDNNQSENRLNFDPSVAIWHPDLYEEEPTQGPAGIIYWSGSEFGTNIIQLGIGSGFVTVFSDLSIWRNREIAHFDHANLLYEFTLNSDRVHFLYGAEVPSVWERLRKYFPEAMIAAVVFILVWLWSQTPQFGPRKIYQSVHRRSLSEHLIAASEFIWRSEDRHQLLDDARNGVLHIAYQRIPGFKTLPEHKQITLLAKHCKWPESKINELLFTQFERIDNPTFKSLIQDLQTIRKAL